MELDQRSRLASYTGASELPGTKPAWQRARHWLARCLSRYYLHILLAQGIAILLIEGKEHSQALDHPKIYFISEVILITLLLGVFILMTRALVNALREKVEAVETLRQKNHLSAELTNSRDTTDIVERMAANLIEIGPITQTALYVPDAKGERLLPVRQRGTGQAAEAACIPSQLDARYCHFCLSRTDPRLSSLATCPQTTCRQDDRRNGYCLPLVAGGFQAGVLHLDLAGGQALTPAQTALFENLRPEISTAILAERQKKAHEDERLAQQIRTTQLDLARDLHDTIGQNVSYLRLKLDQLAEKGLADGGAEQLGLMRDVADETYDMVRGTLAMLQTESAADLPRLFSRYASQVAERSGIDIQVKSSGSPQPVSPIRLRHLFYIFRECLNNSEKHSRAERVQINLNWLANTLELVVADNGIGFDANRPAQSGHYGLAFMRQRAAEINGALDILSSPDTGTRVSVRVPCG